MSSTEFAFITSGLVWLKNKFSPALQVASAGGETEYNHLFTRKSSDAISRIFESLRPSELVPTLANIGGKLYIEIISLKKNIASHLKFRTNWYVLLLRLSAVGWHFWESWSEVTQCKFQKLKTRIKESQLLPHF